MKRRLFLTMFGAAAAASALPMLSGCSKEGGEKKAAAGGADAPAAQKADDLLAAVKKKGRLVIAMEGTWSPWTYHDEKGALTGYDVAVGRKIAEAIGVEPEFVEGKWDGLLAGLDAGRYDIMVNGVGITEARRAAYDFSEPYAFDRVAVIALEKNDAIHSMADLKGKHTANTISSTYAEVAEKAGATVTGVDDLNQTFELLLSGRIDATINSEVTFYDYKKAHPDAPIKIACYVPGAGEIGIPLKKGAASDSLRQVVNDTIEKLRASGELGKLSQEFFGVDISTAKPAS